MKLRALPYLTLGFAAILALGASSALARDESPFAQMRAEQTEAAQKKRDDEAARKRDEKAAREKAAREESSFLAAVANLPSDLAKAAREAWAKVTEPKLRRQLLDAVRVAHSNLLPSPTDVIKNNVAGFVAGRIQVIQAIREHQAKLERERREKQDAAARKQEQHPDRGHRDGQPERGSAGGSRPMGEIHGHIELHLD